MNKKTLSFLLLPALAFSSAAVEHPGENARRLHLLQDDAQEQLFTKVYELKHVAANDLVPFVLSFVKRYNVNSSVERVNYVAGKQQLLLVSTPKNMIQYVDDIIAKLDVPHGNIDANGSVVAGTGIYRFSYQPQYRSSDDMVTIINKAIICKGYAFRDPVSNLIYWKESQSTGKYIGQWMKKLDHPLPRAALVFRIYQVRRSDLKDIGVDYLAWKNGPGLNLFGAGLDATSVDTVQSALSNIDQASSWSYGGFFFAPSFDLSFVRMLSQHGKAKLRSSASLSVINNYSGTYSVQFSPNYQNLAKDDSDQTTVIAGSATPLKLTINNPVINFRRAGEADTAYRGDIVDFTEIANLGGTIQFSYQIAVSETVERNHRGAELTDQSTVASSLTADLGVERLLSVYDRREQVEQVVGVPFLADVPGLKYLFSTTTTIDEDSKFFVTVTGRLLHPGDNFAPWSGRLVSLDEFNPEVK